MAALAALAGIAASAWWTLESVAAMAAMPVGQLDKGLVLAVLDATPLGNVLTIRSVALLVATVVLWRRHTLIGAVAASAGLATTAWTGHAGATEATLGTLHRVSDIVHLLAAATWIGALVLFLLAAIADGDRQRFVRHLSGFATTGSVIVLLLILTGLANTLLIAGWPIDWGSGWFLWLSVKLGLFLAMLGLAAANRWRLTPALAADPACAPDAIRRALALEIGAAFVIVAIVAWLGTLTPGG
jgi:putative copper resistance protein D